MRGPFIAEEKVWRRAERIEERGPGPVAQLVGASSRTPKGCRFDPGSGHIPRLWGQGM